MCKKSSGESIKPPCFCLHIQKDLMTEDETAGNLIVGVDIGGSHITAALVDLNRGCKVEGTEVRRKIDSDGAAETILTEWTEVIAGVMKMSSGKIEMLGIAMPGPFDYENGISLITGMNKYESLYGIDIRKHLAAGLSLEERNILFRNDAEAFLDGEVYCGAAKGIRNVIGITLGTGLGSAIASEGTIRDANLGVSGFKEGIAEDYLSTRWFVRRYNELSTTAVQNAYEVSIAADQGDEAAKMVFQEFSSNLRSFLQTFIISSKPDMVVIGGNIARAHKWFLELVRTGLNREFPDLQIVTSSLWEEAALVGAACCWSKQRSAA
jgi:glucokinase